ncbi:hypothetical protein IGI04_013017 [Brassica rapa subsp. trilocularis]|uniref:Uncharacterized protein n=1 Tax=Brassica rapa subsp. trilocularis TaxID=1813537 RepID=A0ABQ7N7N6_BRACM|nr:hypothetical protein IGI04_013017 [Brassica rapa subsp. trilocularis]
MIRDPSFIVFLTPQTEVRHDLTLNASLPSLAEHKPHGGGRSLLLLLSVKRALSEVYDEDSLAGEPLGRAFVVFGLLAGVEEVQFFVNSVHVFSFKNMKTSNSRSSYNSLDTMEVHHAIFKASKLLYGDDELLITYMPKEEVERYHISLEDLFFPSFFAYLMLMKILTLQGLAVETVELKGGLLERFTHEMEPFLRKQEKLETETIPDKACNGTSILDSLEESKMGLDVRMCNGNGLQGVSVGLAGSMIYAPTLKKDYVGRICTVSGILK